MMRLASILLLGLHAGTIQGQELPVNTTQQLEHLAALSEEEPDESVLLQLSYWQNHPLNLNTAGAEALKLFPFLSGLQVSHLMHYRQQAGGLVDVHELQAVPGWDLPTIRALLPYVYVGNRTDAVKKGVFGGGEHLIQLRWSRTLQKAKGYQRLEGAQFAGDPNHLLLRYLYRQPQQLQYGLVMEKDAGEAVFRKGRTTPDFSSFHFFRQGKGRVKALAIGDYTLNLGQGLIHWQALAFGKGPEVMAVKRQGPVLRPYAAAGEFFFLRGAGVTLGKGPWEATLFAARQRVDANRRANDSGATVVSSFVPSGMHRTASEYESRRALGQWAGGAALQYRKGLLSAGLNGVVHRFDLPIEKSKEPYNLFAPVGRSFYNLSADYGFTVRNMHLFGEAAVDYKGRGAVVQGALLSVHPTVDLSLLGRLMHKGYTAISANAFTESSSTTNEKGMYMGVQWRPVHRLRVSAYADLFRWSWLRFRVDGPGTGAEYLLQLQWQPARGSEAYFLLRNEVKPANLQEAGAAFNGVVPRQRQTMRLQWSINPAAKWQVRLRAEAARAAHGEHLLTAQGFLFFADGRYRFGNGAAADGRLAWFATDTAVRIYAYEQDVLFGYSIPGLGGKGLRAYANLQLPLNRHCTFWIRVAHTLYTDRKTIGAGLTSIASNERTDVRVQAVLRF